MQTVPFPLVIVDGAKNVLEIKEQPQRIISLSPGVTELLFAIGAGDRVVAVTTWCNYPPEAAKLAKVGDMNINYEVVAELSPDLVVADNSLQQTTAERLVNLGLTVLQVKPVNIVGILDSLELLGRVTGCLDQAQDLIGELTRLLAANRRRVENSTLAKEPVSVLVLLDPEELYSAGSGTYIDEVITRAGGTNLAGGVPGAWPKLSLEYVLAKDPEVILLTYGEPTDLVKNPYLRRLSAVKAGRVYLLDPDIYNRPTDRLIKGIPLLTELFLPVREAR